jgi:uncharacterized protein with von Willebrand factor type A (vWA) domain
LDPGAMRDTTVQGPAEALIGRLIGFGRYLRRSGLAVGPGRVLAFCRAAAALDVFDRDEVRLAARATLVSRPEDFPLLEEAFDRYFRRGATEMDRSIREDGSRPDPLDAGPAEGGKEAPLSRAGWSAAGVDEETEGKTTVRVVASAAEVLRTKDFAELAEAERREALALVRRLVPLIPLRSSRRYRVAPNGARFDLQRTLRRSLRTEGQPFVRAWKERQRRQRPLVLLLDVSGSMAPYGRAMMEFAHAAAMAGRRVEVFAFGTRLTRITRHLRTRDPGEALAAVGAAVSDWEGGTRIGDSVKALLESWAGRSALRGSVVVLCSDGLERGDPDVLAQQVKRLSRLVHGLVWVNPLKGSPRYEPLARGMAAALPFVDVFLPGHNVASLEALADAVTRA